MKGRDALGRFTKGNQIGRGNGGGPGRPKRPIEERYLRALMEVVTPEVWVAIVKRAVEDAKQGDAQARRWLANYLIGRPIERQIVQIGTMDPRERELLEELAGLYASLGPEGVEQPS